MEYNVTYRDSPTRQAGSSRRQLRRPAPGEVLYVSIPGSVYRISEEECVFRTRNRDERHVMTVQVFTALTMCQRFATLAEHSERIQQSIPELSGRADDVQRVLQALYGRGLLVTAEDFVASLSDGGARNLPAPSETDLFGLIVRTADRPERLAAGLESVRDNQERFGVSYPVVVLDDSRDPGNAARNAEIVEEFPEARLLDADWQSRFVDELAQAFPDREPQIRYLLERQDDGAFTGGRLWNLAVLLTAGRRFLMLDDDILCQPRRMQDRPEQELWRPLLAERPPRAVQFLPSAEAATEAGVACEFDPVGEHARFLGGVMADALNDERTAPLEPAGLWGFEATSWMGLEGHSRIISTISGTYGDSASAGNGWIFTVSNQSRERLWADREDYERYCMGHHVWANAERFTISPLIGMSPVGLDNRNILPPTLPRGRNEDFLFNASLRYVYPDSVNVSFPWALGHFRAEERAQLHDARKSAMTANLAQFIGDLAISSRGDGLSRTGDGRFPGLAAISLGLADNPDDVLLSRVDEHLLYVRSSLVRELQQQLARNPEAPPFWLADVREVIETNGRAITAQDSPRLADMPRDLDRASSAHWLRERLRQYGEAMSAWPELWRHCRDNPPSLKS